MSPASAKERLEAFFSAPSSRSWDLRKWRALAGSRCLARAIFPSYPAAPDASPRPLASPASATMDAISPRQVLACGFAKMASRRQLSKSLHVSASPKQPLSRCDLSLPEIPSSPAGNSPSIIAGPGLTNGCRLSLGSNVRKTARVKAFGQPGDSLQRVWKLEGFYGILPAEQII